MRWQVIKNRLLLTLRRVVLYGGFLMLTFMVVAFFLLQLPAVQEALISRYTGKFSTVTDFPITFNKFYLRWYDQLEIEGLEIKDSEKNTMIAISKLSINFRFRSLLDQNNINIDGVDLKKAVVHLKTITETDSSKNLNINVFINRLSGNSKSSGGNPPKINIGEIALEDSKFSINETERDSIAKGFDYHHFNLDVEANLNAFKVIGDTIEFNVNSLQAKDKKTDLKINNLSTFYRISQTSMEFLGLNLSAGESFVSDTVILSYKNQRDLSDFYQKVTIKAKLKNTVIHPKDLALFNAERMLLPEPLEISGAISGKVSRFLYKDMALKLGNTIIQGQLQMDGLPSIDETFIELKVKEGSVQLKDLSFLFPGNIFSLLEPLQKFSLQGKFTGYINDFVANGDFAGRFGRIKSDINLKVNQKLINKSTYSGNLALFNFDLGKYFNDTINFQKVSLTGRVEGSGLTESTADFLLNGNVSSIGVRRYNYSNITTNARFSKQLFNGQLKIDDPNLQFTANGSIDLRPGHDVLKVKATLDTAYFHKIGLLEDYLFISTYMDINTKGLAVDSVIGDAVFKNTKVAYKNQQLSLDSLHLISKRDRNQRSLELKSSLADVSLNGDYFYSTLFNDLAKLFKELRLNIENDKQALAEYYEKKNKKIQDYHADFVVKLNNINPLIALADIDLGISQQTKITGKFTNGITSVLQAYTTIDSLQIDKKTFLKNDIEFSGSKIRDSVNVLAMLTVNSARQLITNSFKTHNLFSELIWNRGHIDFNLDADQENSTNLLRLQSEIDFLNDSTKIKILPTRLKVLNKEWKVNQKNYTLNRGNEWEIHHLQLFNDQESILIDGSISQLPEKILNLSITNLNLNILNTVSTEKFDGTLNSQVIARDLYHNPYFQSKLSIDELTINSFLIGDIHGENAWNREKKIFDIDFAVDRLKERTVSLTGFYDPEKKEPLFLKATLAKTNLKIIEPILRGIFSKIDGTLSGQYSITGSFSKPLVNGEGTIENGQLMVNYLKTVYRLEGKLLMKPNKIIFNDIALSDAFQNKGSFDGYLTHLNYSKFRINLNADFTNFQMLNTTSKDNSLFYGQAYATGTLNMLGPFENMKISATARSDKNTRIFIPLTSYETVEKKDFITFVNMSDTIALKKTADVKIKKSEPSGLTFDLNLDITPDAYAEIIRDIKSGDIIRGYGRGEIKLQVDTKGEFNMFGVYEFERGFYNFTLYDLINKEFLINKGSRITWFGDPYGGILSLSTAYRQNTSLAPILTDQSNANLPQIKRKYPVDVVMKLDGPMLSPQINFDILANDLPDNVTGNGTVVQLKFAFNAFKAKLDEQELKKQVFSLIVLRRFSPPDAFATSGSITNSVSELFSNQLSYWLNQVDQNLEIDLDLGSLDQEAFNTFQLRLSYSFLNGRLRVTREGTFNNNQYARTDVSNIVGDWTVDYLLTPDGKFRVKMFNRTNINQLTNTIGTQSTVTTGVSLLHTQSFNSWRDLLTSARDRRRREMEEEEQNKDAKLEEKDGGN
jgi:TamB, inner membrane protein subunit of TAM complex